MRTSDILTEKWKILCAMVLFLSILFAGLMNETGTVRTNELTADCGIEEMTAGHVYKQSFVCPADNLQTISVRMSTFGRINNSFLYVALQDEESEIQNWAVDCRKLEDGAFYDFRLDRKLSSSEGKEYFLVITTDAQPGQGVGFYAGCSAQNGGAELEGAENRGITLCYRLEYTRNTWNRYIWLGMVYIPLSVMLSVLAFRSGQRKTEQGFLVMWVSLSLLFGISSPLFNVPDEVAHFYRAFEIAQGHLVSVMDEKMFMAGRELPVDGDLNLFRESWQSFWKNAGLRESAEPVFHNFFNTALYSPATYIPQSAGIAIARLFTDRIVIIAYAGRIVNWLSVTAILYAAVRILPRGKRFVIFFLLMPMNIQESFSLSPDGMTVAIAVLMASLVLFLRERCHEKMSVGILVLLYVLAGLICLNKIVYMPFCLMYLLIPEHCFGKKRKKLAHGICMGVLVLSLSLGWLWLCGDFLLKQGADSQLQLMYILRHPIQYILVLSRTLIWYSGDWLEGMAGRYLAWLDISVPKILIYLFLFRMAYLLMEGEKNKAADFREVSDEDCRSDRAEAAFCRGILIFMIAAVVILICTSLYMQWTVPYSLYISGIQGRYFIPVLLPLYILIHPVPCRKKGEFFREKILFEDTAFLVTVNVAACICVLFVCAVS